MSWFNVINKESERLTDRRRFEGQQFPESVRGFVLDYLQELEKGNNFLGYNQRKLEAQLTVVFRNIREEADINRVCRFLKERKEILESLGAAMDVLIERYCPEYDPLTQNLEVELKFEDEYDEPQLLAAIQQLVDDGTIGHETVVTVAGERRRVHRVVRRDNPLFPAHIQVEGPALADGYVPLGNRVPPEQVDPDLEGLPDDFMDVELPFRPVGATGPERPPQSVFAEQEFKQMMENKEPYGPEDQQLDDINEPMEDPIMLQRLIDPEEDDDEFNQRREYGAELAAMLDRNRQALRRNMERSRRRRAARGLDEFYANSNIRREQFTPEVTERIRAQVRETVPEILAYIEHMGGEISELPPPFDSRVWIAVPHPTLRQVWVRRTPLERARMYFQLEGRMLPVELITRLLNQYEYMNRALPRINF